MQMHMDAVDDSGIDADSYDQDAGAADALMARGPDSTDEGSMDEGYDDSDASSFMSSILSEVRRGVEISGRLYPTFGKHDYGMPIDEAELDSDQQHGNDLQHHKYTLLLKDRLFVAPVPDHVLSSGNTHILDLGTGSGIWAIDMADRYPSTNILGVDIAATQPAFVPPNCTFEIEDVEDDWPYRPAYFDFIHGRDLMTAVRDWPRLLSQAYAHLKPGGWIQLASTIPGALTDDDSIPVDSGYVESGRLYAEICEKMGAPVDAPRAWAEQMREAGFVNVREEIFKLPMGLWPRSKRLRTVGRMEQIMILNGGFEAYMLRGYTQVMGGRAEDLQTVLVQAKQEVSDPSIHTYVHFHITYGQKVE